MSLISDTKCVTREEGPAPAAVVGVVHAAGGVIPSVRHGARAAPLARCDLRVLGLRVGGRMRAARAAGLCMRITAQLPEGTVQRLQGTSVGTIMTMLLCPQAIAGSSEIVLKSYKFFCKAEDMVALVMGARHHKQDAPNMTSC